MFWCSELGAVDEMSRGGGVTNTEVVIGDIYREFTETVHVFSSNKHVRHPVKTSGHTYIHNIFLHVYY